VKLLQAAAGFVGDEKQLALPLVQLSENEGLILP
jgi:hypothetical protein